MICVPRTLYSVEVLGSYTKLFTVLERDLCVENTVNCRSNGSCVKLFYCYRTGSHFTVLERDLCAENTVHCGGNGSCVKLFTVLEWDLILLF